MFVVRDHAGVVGGGCGVAMVGGVTSQGGRVPYVGYVDRVMPMRVTALFALAIVLASGESAPASTNTPRLTLVPYSFSVQRAVKFNSEGHFESQSESCSLALRVQCDQRLVLPEIMTMAGVDLTEVLTDTGESLLIQEKGGSYLYGSRRGLGERGPDITMSLNLHPPSKPCRRIARIAGSITIGCTDAKLRRVEVAAIGKLADTPIAIEDMPGVELLITRGTDSVKVTGSRSSLAGLADVRYTTAEGGEVNCSLSGCGMDGDRLVRRYSGTVPETGIAQLFFYQNVRQVTIPFAVTDIEMVGGPPTERPRQVLKSTEVENGEQPAAGGNGF